MVVRSRAAKSEPSSRGQIYAELKSTLWSAASANTLRIVRAIQPTLWLPKQLRVPISVTVDAVRLIHSQPQ